jgi:probable O-glycosylation ligase (exosortase A-associated)
MGFTFILLLAPQEHFPALAPLRIAMLSAAIAIITHVMSRLVRGRPVIRLNPAMAFALALVIWAVVTIPFSLWPGGSVAYLLETYLKTLVVFVLLANVIDSETRLKNVVWALVLIGVPLATSTVNNFLSGYSMPEGERVVGYRSGLTANPNDLALMLNLILPLCIALFLASRKAFVKLLLVCIGGLLLFAIITTFSRAGFITLMVTGLVYAWRLRKRPQRVWIPVAAILVLCAVPLIPSDYVNRISTIVNVQEDDSRSAQTRLSDLKVAAKLAVSKPIIGSGIGMNAEAMNRARGETWTEIHNVYLQLAVELGLPGLALFLLLSITCYKMTGEVIRHCAMRNSNGMLFHIAEGLRVSLIAYSVAALFHPAAYHFYFYYIAGLAVAAHTIVEAEPGHAVAHSETRRRWSAPTDIEAGRRAPDDGKEVTA